MKPIPLANSNTSTYTFINTMFIQTIYDRQGSKFTRTIIRSDADHGNTIEKNFTYSTTEWFKEEKVGCDLLNFTSYYGGLE